MNLNNFDPDDNITIEVKDYVEKLYNNIIIDDVLIPRKNNTKIREPSKAFDNGDFYKKNNVKKIRVNETDFGILQNKAKVTAIRNFFASRKLEMYKNTQPKKIIYLPTKNGKNVFCCFEEDFYDNSPINYFCSLKLEDIRDILTKNNRTENISCLYYKNNKVLVTPEKEQVRIGLTNVYTKKVSTLLRVPLQNITKIDKNQRISCQMQNACVTKQIEIEAKVDFDDYNFLGKEFTIWCASKKNFSICQSYNEFVIYSAISKINLKTICSYFIELQLKFFMLENEVQGHILTRSLFFYNTHYNILDQASNLYMILDYIKSKTCIIGETKRNLPSYINVYINIKFLLTINNIKNEKSNDDVKLFKKINLNKDLEANLSCEKAFPSSDSSMLTNKKLLDRFAHKQVLYLHSGISFTHDLTLEYTSALINITNFTIYKILKEIYNELFELKQYNCLHLVDKKKLCLHIQKLLYDQKKFKYDVIQIIIVINQIQTILNTQIYTKKSRNNIGLLLKNAVDQHVDSFIIALKLVFKNVNEEKVAYKEIDILFDCLFVFFQSEPFYKPPFSSLENIQTALKAIVRKIIKIHDHNFYKMRNRCRKGFDKIKICLLNLNKISHERLSEICKHFNFDIKNEEINYLIKEKHEIMSIIEYYKPKIKQYKKDYNETDQIIKKILIKGKTLNAKSYKIMRYNLHETLIEIIRDSFVIDQICDLNKNFIAKNEERCNLR